MLDLFSGSGAASRAAAVRGWDVVRVDNGEGTAADVRADLASWSPPPEGDGRGRFDLVWASPPCTALSTASRRRNVEAGLVLVRASIRIIEHLRPRWWVLENVHGATRAIGSLLGPPVACYGSFYLWGVFPPFAAKVARDKTKMSGRRRAERRAAIPWALSEGLVRACEELARELGERACPPSSPLGMRLGHARQFGGRRAPSCPPSSLQVPRRRRPGPRRRPKSPPAIARRPPEATAPNDPSHGPPDPGTAGPASPGATSRRARTPHRSPRAAKPRTLRETPARFPVALAVTLSAEPAQVRVDADGRGARRSRREAVLVAIAGALERRLVRQRIEEKGRPLA